MQRYAIANTALFCVLYEFFAMRISARFLIRIVFVPW